MHNEDGSLEIELQKLKTLVADWEVLYDECRQERDAFWRLSDSQSAEIAELSQTGHGDLPQELESVKRQMTLLEQDKYSLVGERQALEAQVAMLEKEKATLQAEVTQLKRDRPELTEVADQDKFNAANTSTTLSAGRSSFGSAAGGIIARPGGEVVSKTEVARPRHSQSCSLPLPAPPQLFSQNPVVQMLEQRSSKDPELKALMRVVATGQATTVESDKFQLHIKEVAAIVARQALSTTRASPGDGALKRKATESLSNPSRKRLDIQQTMLSDRAFLENHPVGRYVQGIQADQESAVAGLLKSLDAEVEWQRKHHTQTMDYRLCSTQYVDLCLQCRQRKAPRGHCFKRGTGTAYACEHCSRKGQPCLRVELGRRSEERSWRGQEPMGPGTVVTILPVQSSTLIQQHQTAQQSLAERTNAQDEVQ